MAGSKPVGSFTLLKTELKRIFDKGLLLSSYNIYSQFMPRQMEDFILELVALEIAYHAGGLSKYEITKKWTELIWDVDELKRIMTEDRLKRNLLEAISFLVEEAYTQQGRAHSEAISRLTTAAHTCRHCRARVRVCVCGCM